MSLEHLPLKRVVNTKHFNVERVLLQPFSMVILGSLDNIQTAFEKLNYIFMRVFTLII